MPGLLTDQEFAAQFKPGKGVSTRYGPKPPTPDEVAERGTKEWRDAWKRQDEWRNYQTHAGATAYDLGLRDEKDLGKHYFTRMRMGEVDPRARGNWVKANQGWQRGTFKPNDDAFYGQPGNFSPVGAPMGGMGMGPGGAGGYYGEYSNNPGAAVGKTFNDALKKMNAAGAQAYGPEQGVTDFWGSVLGMDFDGSQQGYSSKSQDAAMTSLLSPIARGIEQDAEAQRQQILATIPPGGARDKLLAELDASVTTKLGEARQGMTQQALGSLTDIFQKNKFWTDPLAVQGMQSASAERMAAERNQLDMAIAQLQADVQRDGMTMENQYRYAALQQADSQFNQRLAWDQSQFNQENQFRHEQFDWGKNTWNQEFAQRQDEFNRNYNQQDRNANRGFWGGLGQGLGGLLGGIFSDVRLKENVVPFNAGLAELSKLMPMEYNYNGLEDTPTDRRYASVMAQDLERVMPDAVLSVPGRDIKDPKVIELDKIMMALVNSVKELDARTKKLKVK